MRLKTLAILSSILLSEAHASVLPINEPFSHTGEEWQTKWDTWPTSDGSALRSRLVALREISALTGNATAFSPDFIPGEVCERITGCIGNAAATAAGYAAVAAVATVNFCGTQANAAANAMARNNYALAKQVASYTVTNVAIPIVVVGTATYYFNLKLQNDAPKSKDDQCGIAQTAAIAEQAGTATYGFCLQLKAVTRDKAFSRIDFGTVSTDNTNDDVGLDMKMRIFISTVQYKYSTACSLLGVYLKS